MPRPPEIADLGAVPSRPDRSERLRARILDLLRAGEPRRSWDPVQCQWLFQGEWSIPPGTRPWWELRQRLGGRIDAATFRALIEDLLAAGLVLEVWMAVSGGARATHTLVLPGHAASLRHPVARARGRPDVLAREPWAAALAARSGGTGGRGSAEGR